MKKMTNKWYGKFRNSSMAVSVSNPWGLERAIPNGKILSNYDFTLHVDGTVDKTLNTTNRVICNPDYKVQGLTCVADCSNPIYLDTNGVTVKAKACAEAGKTYQWNGDNWYVAIDKNDVRKQIFINNLEPKRIITSKLTDMSYMLPWKNYDICPSQWASWDWNKRGEYLRNKWLDITTRWYYDYYDADLSNWDTSNVVDMEWLFLWNYFYRSPIKYWDISKVQNMDCLLKWTMVRNQDDAPFYNFTTHTKK